MVFVFNMGLLKELDSLGLIENRVTISLEYKDDEIVVVRFTFHEGGQNAFTEDGRVSAERFLKQHGLLGKINGRSYKMIEEM